MQDSALGFTLPAAMPAAATPAAPRGYSKALWLIGIGLLANAVVLFTHSGKAEFPDLVLDRSALAQDGPAAGQPLGARGIYMMPAQLGPQDYGLYLMDVDSSTICVYRAVPQSSRFHLMAVRSFKNDRFVEDMNNDSPSPKEVQKLVEVQRQREALQAKSEVPTVSQSPKPDENLPDAGPTGMK